ncbi:MAG: DUF4974 domain-containing protein [Bacteroidetes bacterium]|nr:DUF4974 domain-containing protein [Bacteroidota bacterium]
MRRKELDKIIDKYLEGNASSQDLELLEKFEFIEENRLKKSIFKSVSEKEALKKEILLNIKKNRISRKIRYYDYAAAASIALLVSLTLYFNNKNNETLIAPIIVNTNPIEPGIDKATLTLEDGLTVKLEKGNVISTKNAKSDGEQLVYNHAKAKKSSNITYNSLTTPRGGEFQLILADGTKVWMNSESQLKYPVRFIEGRTLEVELVYGEAYFDVSPSTDHKRNTFKVLHKSQEIEVFGTEFNVKAYKDETTVYTTLVEGKVALNTGNEVQNLAPNQQAVLNLESGNIAIKNVDVNSVTSWIRGDFVFQRKPLKDIVKVLSRWYDVDIEIQNASLEDLKFNGELSKHQDLDEILSLIKNTNFIYQYEKTNEKIILK